MAISTEQRRFLRAFGLRLKTLRVQRDLTQDEMARKAGLHRTFLGQLERGQRGINIAELPSLAAAFDLEIGELFSDDALLRWPQPAARVRAP